jgi:hypothetical protein
MEKFIVLYIPKEYLYRNGLIVFMRRLHQN